MCTLVVATQIWPDTPLLVAANRDENLLRPATGFSVRKVGTTQIYAPQDLEAGGTWLGLNEHGVFVGLTNRFGMERKPEKRSRGHLVEAALEAKSAWAAAAWAQNLEGDQENGFHLVMADVSGAYLARHDGTQIHHEVLSPGVHIITERSFGAGPTRRNLPIVAWWAKHGKSPQPPDSEALRELLATHDQDGFEGVCVHLPSLGYGTRASTIIRLGTKTELAHAEGPPCTHPHRALIAPF